MAMMREQRDQDIRQRMEVLEIERRRVEELAYSLSQQANVQWRKAIEGVVALPAAMTVGLAASTLYLVGFVTRGLQIFQAQALDLSQQMRGLGGGERGQRDERDRGDGAGERQAERRPEMPAA